MLRFAEARHLCRIGTIVITQRGGKGTGSPKERSRSPGESHHREEITTRERFEMLT